MKGPSAELRGGRGATPRSFRGRVLGFRPTSAAPARASGRSGPHAEQGRCPLWLPLRSVENVRRRLLGRVVAQLAYAFPAAPPAIDRWVRLESLESSGVRNGLARNVTRRARSRCGSGSQRLSGHQSERKRGQVGPPQIA